MAILMHNTHKLLQINATANSGSTGRIAEGIGRVAQSAGFESWIAYGRVGGESTSNLIQIGTKYDYLEHGFESRIFDNHGLGSRSATRSFIQILKQRKPDIIHLHNIHGYYLNYLLLFQYLSKADIPVVWTLHDCWAFTGHCAHFDYVGCDRWQTECHHCPQKRTYPASYLFDRSKQNWLAKKHYFTLPKRMTIVPVSNWLGDLVKQSFLGKYPVQVIHNGIDTDVFHPYSPEIAKAKYGLEEKKVLLGAASVWSPRKGLRDFIELAKILPQEYQILLVGLSRNQAKGLPENITAIPRTESTQALAELYSVANVILNLSYEETFGMTSVEGFACGTQGIAYDRTASPELFNNSKVGRIVPAGDIACLLNNVIELTSKEKSSYAEVCRKHALKHFQQQDRFQEYIDLYKGLITEK